MERYKAEALEATGRVRAAERRLRDQQERLTALEDKVDEPRQQLERAREEEKARIKRINTFQKEIEVGYCYCIALPN